MGSKDGRVELDLSATPGAKTTTVVSTVTGENISPDLLAYHDLMRIVMAVEDDPALRRDMGEALLSRFLTEYQTADNRELLQREKLISHHGVGLVTVHSPIAALEVLANVTKYSPHIPFGTFFLDLNMGGNASTDEGGRPGERMPTDSLFLDSPRTAVFRQFLNGGGIAIEYTGMPDQLMQAEHVLNLEKKYSRMTLVVGTKSKVNLGDLVEFVSRLPEDPERCRNYMNGVRAEREGAMSSYLRQMDTKPEDAWSDAEKRNMAVIRTYQANPWVRYDALPLVEAMKRRDLQRDLGRVRPS
ncbi:MAG: hypothetical protein WCV90_02515 [Candidatus Woesearchaeota archaeon]|jgi:hypothetical protein